MTITIKLNNTETFLAELAEWCLNNSKADKKLTTKVIREFVLWKWSTRHGKYKDCEYWSEKALEKYKKAIGKPEKNRVKGLIHEHVIPKSHLTKWLLKKYSTRTVSSVKIAKDLQRLCHGCVLTKAEDLSIPKKLRSEMPKDWNEKDPWARYREAFKEDGITIFKVDWIANGKTVVALQVQPR